MSEDVTSLPSKISKLFETSFQAIVPVGLIKKNNKNKSFCGYCSP